MEELLSSNILSTGNKFVVAKKTVDGTFRAGTTGIISYIEGIDTECANVVFLLAVILKRGKTGKQRIDLEKISTPIFNFKKMDSVSIMPNKERKRYIYTEPTHKIYRNIHDMGNLEYLGWAFAWVLYLQKLSKCTKPFCIWPKKENHILNRMLKISSFWEENADYVIEDFCNKKKRESFTKNMRIIESTLSQCSLSYMVKVAESEVNASEYLIRHNKKAELCNTEVLNETYGSFMKKYKNLVTLNKKTH